MEYKKLGEIATVLRGASPRPIKKYITNDSDGVNWIKIGDVPVGSKYITQSEEKITKESAKKSRYVRKGDFILSNSMSFGRPYILAIDGCIHDGWLSISNFKDVFLSDYLYYLLSSSAIQQEIKKRASFGGAVQNLNADIVKALVLPVPPIEVQNEIVRILDDYTENVVELQNQLALEITARQRQYTFYRNKLLTYDSKTRIMPLKDVAEIERGTRVVRSQLTEAGLYPVFQNALTPMGYYDKANRLENNTFLICAGAAGQIGYSDVDFWAADDCYTFKCYEKLENRYLFHVLKNSQHRIDAQVRRTSIPRISREAVGETEKLFEEVPVLEETFASPVVPMREKLSSIDKIFPEEIKNFLKVVCRNQRMSEISQILFAYDRYCKMQEGIQMATLTCVEAPDEKRLEKIREFLCEKYHKTDVKIEIVKDPALLGGFILKTGDDEYDWSLKGRLSRLEQKLTWR